VECVPAAVEVEVEAATQSTGEQPTGNYGKVPGVSMLGEKGIEEFKLFGDTSRAELTFFAVEGQAFTDAVRAKVIKESTNTWDVQIHAKTVAPVKAGDVLLGSFWFRTEWSPEESGEGQTEFVFELAEDPYTKSVSMPVRSSREWRKYYVPFTAAEDYEPGKAQMIFRLGYRPETIELGGVKVENFGKQLVLADLPVTGLTYKGIEADAPWRKAAADRIEQHRKAPLNVVVKDAAGAPVPGADVHVKLTKHAFGFGTAVQARRLSHDGELTYKSKITNYFNLATIENNLKWVALEGDWGDGYPIEKAERAVDWLTAQGIPTRGHVLIWPGWRNLPKSLKAVESKPEELKQRVADHIRGLATRMKGKLPVWDVMNEPFDNHDLMNILGKDVMVEWFQIARDADPNARLFINDYAILSGGAGTTPHRDHYEETIQFLLDKGAPLDGIGMQGHFGSSLTGPDDLLVLLDRYAKFGKPITVTEFDVVVDDDKIAASYTRDFYTTLFSHPAVDGIVMWGFWDRVHWKNNAVMFGKDWSLKPAGEAYVELTQKLWHTDERGESDASGSFATRGFLGTYTVEVTAGGKTKQLTAELGKGGAPFVVTLD
jgi:GH35 family endo-1,4-beta-xylanase